jgi:hypothetical protein
VNTNSKRIGSTATAIVAVGLIIGGSFGVARAVGQSPAAPAPTSTYEPESVPMTPRRTPHMSASEKLIYSTMSAPWTSTRA